MVAIKRPNENGGGELFMPDRANPIYPVLSVDADLDPSAPWAGTAWDRAPALAVDCFRPESSPHRPRTRVKLMRDGQALWGFFDVQDRYVRCRHTRFQAPVYKDSCVEFFVQPHPDSGYFNFEFNCGGALLASYITDATRTAEGFQAYRQLTPEEGQRVGVWPSMPPVVDPEIAAPRTWKLVFRVPFDLLAQYAGPLRVDEGATWRANFFKCGDETSHPHWAAWCPVDALNFHLPRCFGYLRFV